MRRIAVIGCGGSGKSYVARRLGALLAAPVTHLDAVFYDGAHTTMAPREFAAAQHALVVGPAWVIDGNYNATLQIRLTACDTAVFLDLPTRQCLWGVFSRWARHPARHQDGGTRNRLTWNFVRYVATYRRTMRPKALAQIGRHAAGAEVVVLTDRRAVRRWLDQVAARAG